MRKFLGVVSALVTGLVLVGLVVLTAARFVDSGDRWLILLATFSSYAVLGFLVVLVGCALTWRWARRRRWVAVFALLAALGIVVQGFALVPLFVGGSSGKPALTVMTSNLEFGRADTVADPKWVASHRWDDHARLVRHVEVRRAERRPGIWVLGRSDVVLLEGLVPVVVRHARGEVRSVGRFDDAGDHPARDAQPGQVA